MCATEIRHGELRPGRDEVFRTTKERKGKSAATLSPNSNTSC